MKEIYDEAYFLKGTKSGYGGKFAPYTAATFLPRARKTARMLINMFEPKTALELGCARGYLTMALRELGVDAQGIDISPWAIENAPQQVRPFLTLGDASKLYIYDKSFDLVVAIDLPEHIEEKQVPLAVSEWCRVALHFVYLKVPIIDNGIDETHVTIKPALWWIRQFDRNGFRPLFLSEVKQIDGITAVIIVFGRNEKK